MTCDPRVLTMLRLLEAAEKERELRCYWLSSEVYGDLSAERLAAECQNCGGRGLIEVGPADEDWVVCRRCFGTGKEMKQELELEE